MNVISMLNDFNKIQELYYTQLFIIHLYIQLTKSETFRLHYNILGRTLSNGIRSVRRRLAEEVAGRSRRGEPGTGGWRPHTAGRTAGSWESRTAGQGQPGTAGYGSSAAHRILKELKRF